jgi:hypothetical protein
MPRLILIALLISVGAMAGFAQDSVHKKAVAKSAPVYKRHRLGYYWHKADSVAKSPVQPGARRDTSAIVPSFADKSLNGQYQYLLSKVYHYQQPLISALWTNASDTLNANKAKLNSANAKISTQGKEIDSLKTQLGSEGDELNTSNARTNGIDFLGMIIPKTTYNLLVWGLIAALAIVAVVVISRSAAYGREARYRTQLYTELEEEYKTYKAKANEKEKKLARELQTERNKLDELLGRG